MTLAISPSLAQAPAQADPAKEALLARLKASHVQQTLYPLAQRLRIPNYTASGKPVLCERIVASFDVETIERALAALEAPQAPAPSSNGHVAPQGDDAADRVAKALREALATATGAVDAAAVERIVDARMATERDSIVAAATAAARESAVQRIVVETRKPDGTTATVDVGVQHERFPRLLRTVKSIDKDGHYLAAWLHGPAGTGKTTAGMAIARALGQRFRMSGKLDSEFGVLGFIQPSLSGTDRCVRTEFREAYEHGDVWLWDEADRSSPAAAAALHAALANGACAFPDTVVSRHPAFRCIVGANTFGAGNSAQFSAAVRQDQALLDRFVPIYWGIDERLEAAKCVTGEQGPRWLLAVRAARAVANGRGMRDRITPRATVKGCALLANGADFAEVSDLLTADCDSASHAAILAAAKSAWDGAA